MLHVDRGELDAAAELGSRPGIPSHPGVHAGPWHAARGRLALVQHRDADALREDVATQG